MSSTDGNRSPEKKKKIDTFEWTVYTLAAIVVAMLVGHWIGLY